MSSKSPRFFSPPVLAGLAWTLIQVIPSPALAADPDLDVTFIERLPRYDYDAAKNNPEAGDPVTFIGHIRYQGEETLADASYAWYIDGAEAAAGNLTDILPGEERLVDLPWTWASGSHTLKLTVDPDDDIAELSEANNSREDRTDALIVGFWVEQSVHDYFLAHQAELGVGATSWEDWAQRQMAKWNELSANAVWPLSPQGVLDRVRIDKIVVVPDGALPLGGSGLPSNNPDMSDKTVDLMWGFPATLLGGSFYADHVSLSEDNPFYLEKSLIHEMAHARYLIDSYGFDTHNTASHDSVQIWEGDVYVAGSSYMPFLAYDEVLYYNKSGGVMTGPYGFAWSPYEAGALNRIAGQRAVCGNYNAPCNIGEYLQDLPEHNHLRLVDQNDLPLSGANVRIYNVEADNTNWYGKTIDNSFDQEYTADGDGYIHLPGNPFNPGGDITHTYGLANGVMVLRIEYEGQVWYRFQEVSDYNIAYWQGNTVDAFYELALDVLNSQYCPPADMAEANSGDWQAWAQYSESGNTYVEDDTETIMPGSSGTSSLKFVTDGGFDTMVRYPKYHDAQWDLSESWILNISFLADNPSPNNFQNGSPWIRLIDREGNYYEYRFMMGGYPYDLLNEATMGWIIAEIPLDAPETEVYGWARTEGVTGAPDLTRINALEIHADTWDSGFVLWLDEIFFDPPPPCPCGYDADGDGDVDGLDLALFPAGSCNLGDLEGLAGKYGSGV